MFDRRLLAGAGFALLSSLGFSALTIFAVLAYREGVNPLAAVIVRFPGAIIVLIVILLISGVSMRLKRRDMLVCWGLGALVGGQSYTLYESFAVIPVGLTMVIFYIYPLIVGVVAGMTGQDRIGRALGVAMVIAFAGLVLVFKVSGADLTFEGAAFAVLSACFWAAMTLLSVRVIRECDPARRAFTCRSRRRRSSSSCGWFRAGSSCRARPPAGSRSSPCRSVTRSPSRRFSAPSRRLDRSVLR